MKKKVKLKTVKCTLFLLLIGTIHLSCTTKKESTNYSVGFNYYKVQDSTRLYIYNQDTIFRPMLIHFWYPSEDNSGLNKMSFKQYVDLISMREDYSKPKEAIDTESINFINAYAGFAKSNFEIGLNSSTQEILDSPVEASLGISKAMGKFPMIIYAPSNSKTPIQNHVICEHLASQGYFVISVASAGQNSIQRKETGPSILAQVKDMEFILEYMEKNIKLKYSTLGLLSFSTGGLASAIFQMKYSNVKAVCSLDGTQEYSFYPNLSKLEDFNLERTEVPYFLMHNKTLSSVYPFYNSIKSGNKLAARLPHLDHFGFVSFWTYFDACKPDTVPHNYSISYQKIRESASDFFDAALFGNIDSIDKLRNRMSQNKDFAIPEKLDYSQATALLNTFLQENIDSAISTYKNHKAIDFNKYDYNEEEISVLGRMLLDYDLSASEKLFLFNQEEYPGSWHVYFDLAYSYKLKGDIDLAKKILLKAEEKEPDNKDVQDLLKELENEE